MTINFHGDYPLLKQGRPQPNLIEYSKNILVNTYPLGSFGYMITRDFAISLGSSRKDMSNFDEELLGFCFENKVNTLALKESIVFFDVWSENKHVDLYEAVDLNLYRPEIEKLRCSRDNSLIFTNMAYEKVRDANQNIVVIGDAKTDLLIHYLQFKNIKLYLSEKDSSSSYARLPSYPHVEIIDKLEDEENTIYLKATQIHYLSRDTFSTRWKNTTWRGHRTSDSPAEDYFKVGVTDKIYMNPQLEKVIEYYEKIGHPKKAQLWKRYYGISASENQTFDNPEKKKKQVLFIGFEDKVEEDEELIDPECYPDIIYTIKPTSISAKEIVYVKYGRNIEERRQRSLGNEKTHFGTILFPKDTPTRKFIYAFVNKFKEIGEIAGSRFLICDEQTIGRAFSLGAIPIYYGPEIDCFNQKSYIRFSDYPDFETAMRSIRKIEYSSEYQTMLDQKLFH
jgi:hypothetical protein